MADINTSADANAQRKYIVSRLRALDGSPHDSPRGAMFGEAADLIEALSRDLEAMRARVAELKSLAGAIFAAQDTYSGAEFTQSMADLRAALSRGGREMSDWAILLAFGFGCAFGIVATLIYWPWIAPEYFDEKEPKP